MQTDNVVIDFLDGGEQRLVRNIRVEVDRFQSLGEAADGVVAIFIIAFYMFSGAGNRQDIEKLEIILSQQGKQARCRSFLFRQVKPSDEALLGISGGCLNTWNAIMGKCVVPVSGNKSNLIFQIRHTVVDGSCRQHKNLGRHTGLDDLLHQQTVP